MNDLKFYPEGRFDMPQTQPTELRDYFAAHAMQAIISNDTGLVRLIQSMPGDQPNAVVSVAAYVLADAMLLARGAGR